MALPFLLLGYKWRSEAPRPQAEASRQCNVFLYCAPLPRLQGRACGARSGQRDGDYLERSIFGELDGLCWALADAGPALDTLFGMDRIRFILFHLVNFARTDLNTVATTLAFILIH